MTRSLAPAHFRGRGVVVGVLIGLASLMVIVGIVAVWLNTVVYDTPTWRATSQSIIQDQAMQTQVSNYVVDQLYNSTAVQSEISSVLPPQFQAFAPAVASGLHQVAVNASERLLATTAVQHLFVEASVQAHDAFVRLIDDQSKFAKLDNGQVVLDLHPVLVQVADKAGVGGRVVSALPPTAGQIDVMNSNQLSAVQTAVRIIHALSNWALVIVVALFAVAIWLADGFRRRALLWSAIGILVATLVSVFIRRVLGEYIIDALTGNVSVRPALITAWYIGTDVLGTINVTLFIVSLVLIVGLWLVSGGRYATWVRTRLAPWIANPYYAFGVPAALLLILVVWEPLPVFHKFWSMVIIIVLAAVGIEAIRRITIAEQAGAPTTDQAQTPAA
jgi:hypothetical protein